MTCVSIITSHGGIIWRFCRISQYLPNPEQYYLPVDGHPNISGHALLSKLLAKALTSGPTPCTQVAAHRGCTGAKKIAMIQPFQFVLFGLIVASSPTSTVRAFGARSCCVGQSFS